MTSSVFSATAVDELSASFDGELIRDDDDRYDGARKVWNGHFDRRPGLIARPSA